MGTYAKKPQTESFVRPGLRCDDLAAMGLEELRSLYEGGRLMDIDALDGAPRGRLLAVVGPLGQSPLRGWVARLARSERFPWRGKSFAARDASAGSGVNRVLGLGERFRFDTRVEPSAIDGRPCVRLDYGQPGNPFFIRAIRDELREVAPALFLGPAMLDGAKPRLVLWFAIDKQ
jgi:hypothetical protein